MFAIKAPLTIEYYAKNIMFFVSDINAFILSLGTFIIDKICVGVYF